jgi:hypothetical protein
LIRRTAIILCWLALGAALATGFIAYRQPSLLLDSASLRYCG